MIVLEIAWFFFYKVLRYLFRSSGGAILSRLPTKEMIILSVLIFDFGS